MKTKKFDVWSYYLRDKKKAVLPVNGNFFVRLGKALRMVFKKEVEVYYYEPVNRRIRKNV